MKRIQLFELHERTWCPRIVRDAVTDFLQYSTVRWRYYTAILPTLCYFVDHLGAPRVIDLCSGGGGPWQYFYRTLSRGRDASFKIVLTDQHPNIAAFEYIRELSGGLVEYRSDAIDVAAIPLELIGFRTLFASFHHFPPHRARAVLQDAVDRGQGIGIFEMTDRSVSTLLTMLTTPIFVLLMTPWIRPLCISRFVLTYLVPVVPLVVLFDGLVSCLRTYSVEELEELTSSLDGAAFSWEIRRIRSDGSPFPAIYAIGWPRGAGNP